MKRPWTPDRRNADGSTTVTVKRCCNGCGRLLGDVSLIEIDTGIAGKPLPDVRGECPDCCPVHVPDPSGTFPGPVVPPRCYGCGKELGECPCSLGAEAVSDAG